MGSPVTSPVFAPSVRILGGRMDFHGCSPGGAALVVGRWWRRTVPSFFPLPLPRRHVEIITGWGNHRPAWSQASIREAMCSQLSSLDVCWWPSRLEGGATNVGCVMVLPGLDDKVQP